MRKLSNIIVDKETKIRAEQETKVNIDGIAGDAGYFDFVFDQQTDIDAKSSIVLE